MLMISITGMVLADAGAPCDAEVLWDTGSGTQFINSCVTNGCQTQCTHQPTGTGGETCACPDDLEATRCNAATNPGGTPGCYKDMDCPVEEPECWFTFNLQNQPPAAPIYKLTCDCREEE